MIYPTGSIPIFTPYFYQEYLFTENNAFNYLIRDGILADLSDHNKFKCNCGGNINKNLTEGIGNYRCSKLGCRKRFCLWNGTFIQNSNLPLNTILHLVYLWLQGIGRDSICNILGLASSTVTRWLGRFRFLAAIDLHSTTEDYNFKKIGGFDDNGESIKVEVDESCFGRVKYHRGHPVGQTWVVGGVERTTERRLFAFIVERRNVETLSRVISNFIKPGFTIYTDCWRGYSNEDLRSLGFQHDSVNHSEYFVDPISGVHTNSIEGTWNGMKLKIPPRQRTRKLLGQHLNVYMWRRLNIESLWQRFLFVLFETKQDDIIFPEHVNMDQLEEQWGEEEFNEDDI